MCIDLPIITVQHDYIDVLNDVCQQTLPDDKFWVSCFKRDSQSVHASVRVTPIQSSINCVPEGGIELETQNIFGENRDHAFQRGLFKISCPSLQIPPTPIRPSRFSIPPLNNQPKSITTFDISPDEKLLATGHQDGSICVRPIPSSPSSAPEPQSNTNSSSPTSYLKSTLHKSSLTTLRFFPSSSVLLSSSSDFTLKIISADNLSIVPRTLVGHRRPITDTAVLERGKNVLSCSKDGTIRVWDCGSGKQISMIGSKNYSSIRKMYVGKKVGGVGNEIAGENSKIGPSEVGTADKLVLCALQNGSFEIIDLESKASVYHSSPPSASYGGALTSISYSASTYLLATGSSTGLISLYDIRSLPFLSCASSSSGPLFTCRRNEATIEDLSFLPSSLLTPHTAQQTVSEEVRLAIATSDGLPFILSTRPEGPVINEELVGYDCDPVRCVRVLGSSASGKGGIWCAGDDGFVRKY